MSLQKFFSREPQQNILLAPLAGVTDVAFRGIAKQYGATLTFTEMVSAKGLHYKSKNTEALLATHPLESPCAVQLFGAEPEVIAEAVKNPLLDKFDLIDINMGCPVDKIVKCGEGSALLKDIKLAEQIIRAAVDATTRPISVKFRIGWDDNNIVAAEFAKACEGSGAAFVTIHGRTRQAMYSGRANYEPISAAVAAVNIPVIANGDVFCRADMLRALDETGAAGVMIGRGVLGRPWIFAELKGESADINIKEIIFRHIDGLSSLPDKLVALNMRKHIAWYLKGKEGAKPIKEAVNKATSTKEIKAIIENWARQAH